MTQKITLSVPDILYERIKQWRDSFNLSKMFQEVMTDAIQRKEEFQKRFHQDFDLQDIIKRLKLEKNESEKNFYDLGKKEGLKWSQSAHYDDLIYALQFENSYEFSRDVHLESYFKIIFKSVGLNPYLVRSCSDHEKLFLDGWLKGVHLFWKQIKESL